MATGRRIKPCANCKRSKVKCEYVELLPCQRCVKTGQASSCQFIQKLPSLTLPELPFGVKISPVLPAHPIQRPVTPHAVPKFVPAPMPMAHNADTEWRAQIELKINSFDLKFNDLFEALASRADEPPRKRHRAEGLEPLLSLHEAKVLFQYFDANITQQLFGFEISRFSVDVIWESSPILICAICTIAAMHYPDPKISHKRAALQEKLQELCAAVFFKGRPKTQQEGFNTIVALIICSLWLSDSQRFTGLALQLAKEFGFNKKKPARDDGSLSEKDRLKLWYLLFVLDGQQSMSLNRDFLMRSDGYAVQNPRKLLLDKEEQPQRLVEDKEPQALASHSNYNLADMRLVSQVEYNQALGAAFKGNAWDLIQPSAFGIPSKTNLELDKWMVSWTLLLAPALGTVWLLKLTLIYYNFARMHINCSAMRKLQIDTGDNSVVFPKWENLDVAKPGSQPTVDCDSDDEEFVSNKELSAHDSTSLELNIAFTAAQTVLNLVLNDPDILNNLKYVPVHIHIMLYYAALLLLNPPKGDSEAHYFQLVAHVRTVKMLQRKIYVNLPTDKTFGHRFVQSLERVVKERGDLLRHEIDKSSIDATVKRQLLGDLFFPIEEYGDVSSTDSSPKPERIAAWPGSNHGHP